MGLNIKNEQTVALIRELAARTGQTQTAAIEDAVRSKISTLDRSAESRAIRQHSVERLLAELRRSVTSDEKAAVRAAESDLYDDRGLPR